MASTDPNRNHDTDALTTTTRATLVATATMAMIAMIPCFGVLNWIISPACLIPVVLGVIGLTRMSASGNESAAHPGPFLAAIIGGILLFVATGGRLMLGAGVV